MSPDILNAYSRFEQWDILGLIVIQQRSLGFQSQSIVFTNAFAQADITGGVQVCIEVLGDFNSEGEKCYGFIKSNFKTILSSRSGTTLV